MRRASSSLRRGWLSAGAGPYAGAPRAGTAHQIATAQAASPAATNSGPSRRRGRSGPRKDIVAAAMRSAFRQRLQLGIGEHPVADLRRLEDAPRALRCRVEAVLLEPEDDVR